ncbi:MAG: hypothetical protein WEE50_12045 [Chloroflexota bacterium]
MSELIAFVLAAIPAAAFIALVVATIRTAAAEGAYPPVDLLHRSYGA